MSNLRHWLWLSTRGPAPGMYAARVLEHFGTPEGAYYADSAAYGQIPGIPGTVRQALEDKDLTPAETILAKCKEQGIWILTMQDAAYPQRLRQLESAPCVLYGKGTLPQLDHLVDRLEARAHLKGRKVTKYKYLGLMIFVAIPLPGTGGWTGALIAAFLDMRLKKAIPSIFGGVLIAGFLITGLTYGFTSIF